jgi:hypothetical protein
MDLNDAIAYARWWSNPEADGRKFMSNLEHVVVRQVLAELDRRGAVINRVQGFLADPGDILFFAGGPERWVREEGVRAALKEPEKGHFEPGSSEAEANGADDPPAGQQH